MGHESGMVAGAGRRRMHGRDGAAPRLPQGLKNAKRAPGGFAFLKMPPLRDIGKPRRNAKRLYQAREGGGLQPG